MRFTISWCLAGAAALATCITPVWAGGHDSGVVVFGTSLSDSGNAFALRGGTNTPPDYDLDPLLVPSAPYARGGHHFSNGATWVDQLARSLGVPGSARPAFASTAARPPTMLSISRIRCRRFLGITAATPLRTASTSWRWAAMTSATRSGGFPAAQAILQQALTSIPLNIQLLYRAGAREFLVWLPPNVGLTPAIQRLDQVSPGVAQPATALTQAFNTGLKSLLAQLPSLPGLTMARLDAEALLNDIVARPQDTASQMCARRASRPMSRRSSVSARMTTCSGTASIQAAPPTPSSLRPHQVLSGLDQ